MTVKKTNYPRWEKITFNKRNEGWSRLEEFSLKRWRLCDRINNILRVVDYIVIKRIVFFHHIQLYRSSVLQFLYQICFCFVFFHYKKPYGTSYRESKNIYLYQTKTIGNIFCILIKLVMLVHTTYVSLSDVNSIFNRYQWNS